VGFSSSGRETRKGKVRIFKQIQTNCAGVRRLTRREVGPKGDCPPGDPHGPGVGSFYQLGVQKISRAEISDEVEGNRRWVARRGQQQMPSTLHRKSFWLHCSIGVISRPR
jgi:hypothetical protein